MRIEILARNRKFYWGILPEIELTLLNKSIKSLGFKKAIKIHKFSGRFDYATDPNRSNSIKFLFPNKMPYKVLEIGCGYGNLTVELAKKFDRIDSVDAVYQSLLFTKYRLIDERISNVKLFQTDNFETIDFLDNFKNESYDLIVVNGVLEWIGSGVASGKPMDFQKQFLNTCYQKLSDDGLLFLAIENRYYPGWIKRDPHSKLPFTTIAPRKIANVISLLITSETYRTYIHGYRSLLRLMKKSGFFLSSKFYVYHSYRRPIILTQDNNIYTGELLDKLPSNLLTKKWKVFLRFGIKFHLIDKFIPTFTHIYGKKQNNYLVHKYKYAFMENSQLKFERIAK